MGEKSIFQNMYVTILYINGVLKYVKISVTELSSFANIFQEKASDPIYKA
jgi:hypothetical protein